MQLSFSACLLLAGCLLSTTCGTVTEEQYQQLLESVQSLQTEIEALRKTTVAALAKQVSQQQLYVEEMTRSYGDSGLKLTRLTRTGSKPYFSTSFVDGCVAAVHVHANYKQVLGMGELVAVLNGVEFRTRHNDYMLKMPSKTSMEYGVTEDISFPPVPPEVLEKATLGDQIVEMRKWFKAWRSSDYSVRDYRPYFKANLCYLEGMWTNAEPNSIDEPFESDRNALDADSFSALHEKIRYTSATGTKSVNENFAYLPTTISDVDEMGNIVYSQWNYKILCHPLRQHVPLNRFRLEDDIGARVANSWSAHTVSHTRSARFSLYEAFGRESFSKEDRMVSLRGGKFLDQLMQEIPGKDNYPANITGEAVDGRVPYATNASPQTDAPLNVGYYHNAYRLFGRGGGIHRRGFSDNNVYVAYSTQQKIAPVKTGTVVNRVSYAIPLEIVYTTPLNTWNPYNLTYNEDSEAPVNTNKVNGVQRRGVFNAAESYHGISDKYYYMTPAEFYNTDSEWSSTDADTGMERKGVLDPDGNVRDVAASGLFISTFGIPGVGAMRIRYPIMPIHEHGNTIYKDLSALTDMTLKKHKFESLYPDLRRGRNNTMEQVYMFETNTWDILDTAGDHVHTFEMTQSQVRSAIEGKFIPVRTSKAAGHNHKLLIRFDQKWKIMSIARCDDGGSVCWDGHKNRVVLTEGDYPRF